MSNEQTTPNSLRLEGELTIYRAAEIKQLLLGAQPATEVDLSGVTDLDSVGVQLLMLAKREALAQQREMRLVAHSQAVIDVFELLNLAAYFDDPLIMEPRTAGPSSRHSSNA